MRAYVVSRLAQTALVVFLSLTAVFAMVRLSGDPVLLFMPMDIQAKDVNEFCQRLGFNDPVPVQYARFLAGAVRGDFGDSLRYRQDAMGLVLERLPATLLLAGTSLLLTFAVAVPLGVLSAVRRGFRRALALGRADAHRRRAASFPFILLAMTINAIVALGLRNIILSLSAAGWVVYARVVRGEVLSVKQRDYVQAAAALGMSRARLVVRHVLPNAAPSIIVVASLQFSSFIVAEAAISFLGFGIQPPTPAWGSMLSESRDFVYVAWWLAAFPGAALALTALGVNLLGDWLRDTMDPKLRV